MQPAKAAAPARPATFDRGRQTRRSLEAKIHAARKQLNMVEDDYRAILFDVTGQISLTKCSEPQLARVVEALRAKGFKPIPKKGAASSPMAMKARAMWISLYHLGAVHNPDEAALEAFAKRQLKCERLAWANQRQAYALIEALKDWAEREGWHQRGLRGEKLSGLGLDWNLCDAILTKLKAAGLAPTDWSLTTAAWRLCGIATDKGEAWTADVYNQLAKGLGDRLRALGPEVRRG